MLIGIFKRRILFKYIYIIFFKGFQGKNNVLRRLASIKIGIHRFIIQTLLIIIFNLQTILKRK